MFWSVPLILLRLTPKYIPRFNFHILFSCIFQITVKNAIISLLFSTTSDFFVDTKVYKSHTTRPTRATTSTTQFSIAQIPQKKIELVKKKLDANSG